MTVFARNALGFFIQLYPCALMIFLPFPREAYRLRAGRIFAGMAVAAAALSLAFAAALGALREDAVVPASNLIMLGAVLLILAAYIYLVRDAVMKKVLVFFVALFYAVTQYWLVNAFEDTLPLVRDLSAARALRDAYSTRELALYALTAVPLLAAMLAFVVRPLRDYIQEVETREMRREFAVLIVSMSAFIALMMYIDQTVFPEWVFLRLRPLFFTLLLNQMLVFWLILREAVRRKRDGERRRAMEIERIQVEKIVGDMEITRQMRHDLQHHYNALGEMLEQGRLEEMRAYLDELTGSAAQRQSEVYCKNLTVNGLLQYYASLARGKGIRCEVSADCGELDIEPADLTVVFGNAMENAIRACEGCGEKGWIRVRVGKIQEALVVEIANSCAGGVHVDRRYEAENGFAPAHAFASEREGGGYGLRSIARTALKYGGSAAFRYDEDQKTFTARIRLNTRALR